MSDLIDRQMAVNALIKLGIAREKWISSEGRIEQRGIDASICAIEDLPSAQPKTKWIPINEAKPEPFQKVLVTMRINGWNGEKDDIVESRAYDGDYCITAWMPLPEPYNSDLR